MIDTRRRRAHRDPQRRQPVPRGRARVERRPAGWLEASSHPIRILDAGRVEVLLTSRELADRYGEAPVAVRFVHGEGEVFHMISHYHLQRTELRTARHAAPAMAYAAEKGIVPDPGLTAAMADLSVADVESAHTSARFLANVVAAAKRRARGVAVDKLFVYGTLMPGHLRFPAIKRFVTGARLASAPGRLYDTGAGYPAAVFGGADTIEGWVLDIRPGMRSACLATLNEIEGNLFRPVTVRTTAGEDVLTYEWRGSVDDLVRLSGWWAGE